jgi:transcriptional regulator with XRE-family HTH domain
MSVNATRDVATASTEARIGEILKQLREEHGMSLRALASRAGFSASFISQLENGQVSPSIASLDRIAAELGVTLANLFEASQAPVAAVVRADARPGFTSSWSRARVESLTPPGARRPLEAVSVTLAPRGASGKHLTTHPADQFAYVVKGPLTVFLGEERLTLDTGDSVLIPRKIGHRWQNDDSDAAQVLLVSTRLLH